MPELYKDRLFLLIGNALAFSLSKLANNFIGLSETEIKELQRIALLI